MHKQEIRREILKDLMGDDREFASSFRNVIYALLSLWEGIRAPYSSVLVETTCEDCGEAFMRLKNDVECLTLTCTYCPASTRLESHDLTPEFILSLRQRL